MFTCNNCRLEKKLSEFYVSPRGERRGRCRVCERARARSRNAERRKEARRLNKKLKSGPCLDCGQRYHPVVMDWDHLEDKYLSVSELVSRGRVDLLEAEIAKCELVCANCHRMRTFRRAGHQD